jgi:hypothetical protein
MKKGDTFKIIYDLGNTRKNITCKKSYFLDYAKRYDQIWFEEFQLSEFNNRYFFLYKSELKHMSSCRVVLTEKYL